MFDFWGAGRDLQLGIRWECKTLSAADSETSCDTKPDRFNGGVTSRLLKYLMETMIVIDNEDLSIDCL